MEWLALLIPVITAIVLIAFFKHKTVWWEFIIPFGVSIVLIFICKITAEYSQIIDTECWGGWVSFSEYYEAWDEEVPCSHAKYRTEYRTVTDSDGNSHTESYEVFDGYEHPYDVDYHSPYWSLQDSNGQEMRIGEWQFSYLCEKFRNKLKIDLNRDYHSVDGDKWRTEWKGSDETLEPVVTTHLYKNRVQNANSVFNFRNLSKEEIRNSELFEYPEIYQVYHCDSIFGYGGASQREANRLLNICNAKLGKDKKVRMLILVFQNKDSGTGMLQENYWKRGNKNEIVITIGVDSKYQVNWAYVFSWSENQKIVIEIRDFIIEQKELDLVKIVNWLSPQIKSQSQVIRRDFSTFDYIKIDIPTWQIVLIFVITTIVNIGLSVWIIMNEFVENDKNDRCEKREKYGRYQR